MLDIYFEPNYGKLYENIENGNLIIYEYKCSSGTVRNMFIKREIPILIENRRYYDILTPYGYGGPIIIDTINGKEQELIQNYSNDFKKYCEQENIVSEFIRFHPVIGNSNIFKDIYTPQYIRNTLGTDLKNFADPIQSEFSKNCRKNIRQALNKGLSYKITKAPNNLGNFEEIYYSNMDRKKANKYYYFEDEYFNNCLNSFRENILLSEVIYENKTIAAGFSFIYNKIIHMHLSGTLNEFLYLSPAYIIRYGITRWGIENGYELIHHGGGLTNSSDDTLYNFKKNFAQNTEFKFYIGKKIWNENIYNTLCTKTDKSNDTDFFPAYRSL
jgi:lipid II:glycine glycyltransferase (peptidoglycan interpeptide bridge formation enzyme)